MGKFIAGISTAGFVAVEMSAASIDCSLHPNQPRDPVPFRPTPPRRQTEPGGEVSGCCCWRNPLDAPSSSVSSCCCFSAKLIKAPPRVVIGCIQCEIMPCLFRPASSCKRQMEFPPLHPSTLWTPRHAMHVA